MVVIKRVNCICVSDDSTNPVSQAPTQKLLFSNLLEITVFHSFWSTLVFSNTDMTAMAITTIMLLA